MIGIDQGAAAHDDLFPAEAGAHKGLVLRGMAIQPVEQIDADSNEDCQQVMMAIASAPVMVAFSDET